MKKIKILLASFISVLTLALAAAGVNAQDREMFLNSDLKNGTEGWSARIQSATKMSVETEDTYGGNNSLKVNISGWSFVYQLVELTPGGEYVISYNAKNLSDKTENFSLRMSEVDGKYDLNGKSVGVSICSDTINNLWNEYSFKYKYNGDKKITAKIAFIGPSNYLLSDVRMVQTNYVPEEKKNTLPFVNSVYVDFDNGSDSNNGTEKSPFKTIEKARDFVRCINKEMPEDITVYISGSEYEINDTIKFTAEDGAAEGRKIIYKAADGEKPVIRGAGRVSGWKLHDKEKNIWVADFDSDKGRQLFVNGTRADLAAYEKLNISAEEKSGECIYLNEKSLLKLAHPEDMEVVSNQEWKQRRRRVEKLFEKDGRVRIEFNPKSWDANENTPMRNVYRLDNQYEFLNEPGEYYRDKREHKIYYIPRPGDNMETADAVFPTVEKLIEVCGDNPFSYVSGITFDGLRFEYSTATIPSFGILDNQNLEIRGEDGTGTHSISGAVDINYGHDIDVINCDIIHHGGMGIKYGMAAHDCDVVGNKIKDISAHGVMIGDIAKRHLYQDEIGFKCGTPAYRDINNNIVNNYIANAACEYYGATGITILYSEDTRIANNDLFNLPYTGIHMAWGWDQYTHSLKGLVVENNYLNYIMTVLRDGGGIYSLGGSSATLENPNIWRENYISMFKNSGAPYYLDQGSSYHRLTNNVIEHKNTMWIKSNSVFPEYKSIRGNETEMLENVPLMRPFGGVSGNAIRPERRNTYAENYIDVQSMNRFLDFTGTAKKNVYNIDGHWMPKASEVMKKAGLEDEYKKLRDDIRTIDTKDYMELKIGETASVKPISIRGAKEEEREIDDYKYTFMSSDESVSVVDNNGNISAVGNGHAKIYVKVEEKDNAAFYEIDVTVGSEPAEVRITADTEKLLVSNSTELHPLLYTNYNTQKEYDGKFIYKSLTPNLISVDENGTATALSDGIGKIEVSAECEGKNVSGTIEIECINYSLSNPTKFTTYNMKNEIADKDNWTAAGTVSNGEINFNINGFSNYKGRKFGNEILAFNYKIGTGSSTWPSIMFRGQDFNKSITDNENKGYIICFTAAGEIELQRFNNAVRTQIFCQVNDGSAAGAGPAYKNNLFKYGQTVRIRAGAINETNGVRLILYVNDTCVFDYLDKGEDAVYEDGYFGIHSQGNTITISEYSEGQKIENDDVSVDDILQSYREQKNSYDASKLNDIKGEWYQDDVEALMKKGINAARSETEFGAWDIVTRGEYISMLADYMNMQYYQQQTRGDEYKAEIKAIADAASREEKNFALMEFAKATEIVCDEMVQNGFELDSPITREEAAYMTYQVYKLVVQADVYVYDELYGEYGDRGEISDYAKKAAAAMYGMKFMGGVDNGQFAPKGTIQRIWAAEIIKRLCDTIYCVW